MKKIVRLTESDLHRIVKESVRILVCENSNLGYSKDFILYGDDDSFIRFDTKYGRFAIENSSNSPWLYCENYEYSIPFAVPVKYSGKKNEIPTEDLIRISEELFMQRLKYDKMKEKDEDDDWPW